MSEVVSKNKFLSETKIDLIALTIILILAFFILSPVLKNNFLSYDDAQWVTQNPSINALNSNNLLLYFTTPTLYMYSPLSNISFAFDHLIGGNDPFYFHLSNLILHLLNIVLVFIFAKIITKKVSVAFFSSALFALHPAAVDTVAWISTRSNLLYTFFFLASLLCYCSYLRKNKKIIFYILCILFFVLSCFSKSSAIILPFILLGLDHLTERKIDKNIFLEKIPLFIVSFIFGYLAIHFREDILVARSISAYNFIDKIFLFSYSCWNYLIKAFLPIGLSAVYSYPAKVNSLLPMIFYISALFFPIAFMLLIKFKKIKREIIFGLLFFLIGLAPAIVGFLEDGFIADRYAYLPSLGIFFLAASSVERLTKFKPAFRIAFIAMIACFSFASYQRTFIWKSDLTLFTDVIQKQSDNAFAYNSRGVSNYYLNDLDVAITDYSSAIKIDPNYAEAFCNRAIAYAKLNDLKKALADYDHALEINPKSINSLMGRGVLKMDGEHDLDGACKDFDEVIKIEPNNAQGYYNRGLAELRSGKKEKACEDLSKVKALGFSQADELIEKNCK